MTFKETLFEEFFPLRLFVENKISESISSFGSKTPLRDACEYALKNGGKRFRPVLALIIAKAIDEKKDVSNAALSLEFFHTASLIADDLPCMDNDDTRRNVPSLHKAFNETIAILATYALIAAGYDRIRMNADSNSILSLALENASYNTGIFGATGGQYLDLYPPQLDQEMLLKVLQKKTGALFELSFVFGWLFGGGNPSLLPQVKKAAHHFGLAFQIADDFIDLKEDQKNQKTMNAPLFLGEKQAHDLLLSELSSLKKLLSELSLDSKELKSMISSLSFISEGVAVF